MHHRGQVGKSVKLLVADMKKLMLPYTADKLQVRIVDFMLLIVILQSRTGNQLKDFAHVAGPLGITHFLVFTATELGTHPCQCLEYLR